MANILVTIIHSKIFYADSIQTLRNVVGTAIGNAGIPGGFNSITYATLTEQQFIRFKNAGKRHPSNSGKTTRPGTIVTVLIEQPFLHWRSGMSIPTVS